MLLLVVSEILIFGLFKHLAIDAAHKRYGNILEAVLSVTKPFVAEQLKGQGREGFFQYLQNISNESGLQIWIEDDKEVTFKTYGDKQPQLKEGIQTSRKKLYTFMRERHRMIFKVIIPLKSEGSNESLVIFYNARNYQLHETRFLRGLIIIGVILALLLFPFARYISRPLKKLRDSALRISRGHLDERVDIAGKDEIGQLGSAFNRMAENLENMVQGTREMTANISHEIRSPLARLRVAAEILEEKARMQEVDLPERIFNTFNSEIEEIDHLVGQILNLAKVELRNASIEKETVSFSELLEESLERFRDLFNKKDLELNRTISTDPLPVSLVKEDITMALSCLLDNAVRYSAEKSSVVVSLVSDENEIILSIDNRTEDFHEKDLEEIFEPFKRFNNSPGAGLGLSLVKKVVENHSGSVSAFFRDSIFSIRVYLPVKKQNK